MQAERRDVFPDVVGNRATCSAAVLLSDHPSGWHAILDDVAARTDVWPGAQRWAQGLGRLRDVVRQEIVAEQLGELIAERPMRGRAHTPADLDAALTPFGWRRERWFGVRVFSDHRDLAAPCGDQLEQLLAAEHEAGARDPYRGVAALIHLSYRKSQEPID